MNIITEMLDRYENQTFVVDRYAYVKGSKKLDFAILKSDNVTVWFDHDDGFRISHQTSGLGLPCVVMFTKGNKKLGYTRYVSGKVDGKTTTIDLKNYDEGEYFQASLLNDISELSFDDYSRAIVLFNKCYEILKELVDVMGESDG